MQRLFCVYLSTYLPAPALPIHSFFLTQKDTAAAAAAAATPIHLSPVIRIFSFCHCRRRQLGERRR